MRALSAGDRRVCEWQAAVFESSLESVPSSSAVFVRRFMRSRVAARVDGGGYDFEVGSAESLVLEIDAQYAGKAYGSERYSANELYWMGYVYRAWCIAYGETSRQTYGRVGARELRGLYLPYHTLDVMDAVERIREARGIADEDYVTRGVALLRELRGW